MKQLGWHYPRWGQCTVQRCCLPLVPQAPGRLRGRSGINNFVLVWRTMTRTRKILMTRRSMTRGIPCGGKGSKKMKFGSDKKNVRFVGRTAKPGLPKGGQRGRRRGPRARAPRSIPPPGIRQTPYTQSPKRKRPAGKARSPAPHRQPTAGRRSRCPQPRRCFGKWARPAAGWS